MPPALLGAANVAATMSSNASAWRGVRVNVSSGVVPGQVPRKQRYVAVTWRLVSYEVLKTRTSVKKGEKPWIEAAAARVLVSAKAEAVMSRTRRESPTRMERGRNTMGSW